LEQQQQQQQQQQPLQQQQQQTNTAKNTGFADGQTVPVAVSQKQIEDVSTSLGVMMMGMVTFTMSLFYATHFPDPDVQHTTWVTLSDTMSLFCGVLLFTSFKDIMVLQFGETGGHHDSQPDLKSMIFSLLRTLICFWGVQALLMKIRKRTLLLKAVGSIGGNMIGFAAIDCFGMIQQVSPFRDNPGMASLGMCIGALMIFCMCLSAHHVRYHYMRDKDGIIKDVEKINWHDTCKEVENRFAGICLGLLLSIIVRQAITGTLPAVWGSPRNKTQDQVNILFGISLGMSVPVFAISMVVLALETHANSLPGVARAGRMTQLILSMSMGWSLVFCGQWEFWSSTHGKGVGLGDKMTARIIMALLFSYMSFGFIIGLDFLADKLRVGRGGFEAVSGAFVLGLGLAWQGAFSEATTCLSNRFDDKNTRAYMDALMTFCLCATVMPAWVLYMLPKALAGSQPLTGTEDAKKNKEGQGNEEKGGEEPEETGSGVGMGEAAEAEVTAEATTAAEDASKMDICATCESLFEDAGLFCQNCGSKRASAEELSHPSLISAGQMAGSSTVAEQPELPSSTPSGQTASASTAGAKGSGKAAASVGKGGEGGKGGKGSGKAGATAAPAVAPSSDNQAGDSQWEQNAESWGGNDESWGVDSDQASDPAF